MAFRPVVLVWSFWSAGCISGVPGAVIPTVEPFTKESVLITWDPPVEPNNDIELLTYNVYFDIRNFGEPLAFTPDVPNPDQTRAWNERSVQVSGVTQQQFVVAYVLAVSAQGTGALAAEQSYSVTFGNAARVPPENVSAEQTDNQTVHVSWSAIPSDRQPYVESDVTHYEVQYWSVGGAVQEPINNTQRETASSLVVNIAYQRNNEMVLAARVRGVTQLRREPNGFGVGPWSEVVYSGPVPPSKPNTTVDTMTTTMPLPTPTPSSGNKMACTCPQNTVTVLSVLLSVVLMLSLSTCAVSAVVNAVMYKRLQRCRAEPMRGGGGDSVKADPEGEGPPTREGEEGEEGEEMQVNPAYLPIEMSYKSQESKSML